MDVNNYRPVYILPSVNKMCENIMVKKCNVFLENFNILYEK